MLQGQHWRVARPVTVLAICVLGACLALLAGDGKQMDEVPGTIAFQREEAAQADLLDIDPFLEERLTEER